MWTIEFYKTSRGESPVYEFLKTLAPKEKAKVIREIDLLEEFGPALIYPHTRRMEGDKNQGLHELRPQLGTNAFRIFYFAAPAEGGGGKYVLVHGFRKKTQKTPEKEAATARRRMNAYQEGRDELE